MSDTIEQLREGSFILDINEGHKTPPVVELAAAEQIVSELQAENERLESKVVELALKLAAHVTAKDRKEILASEDVRAIMDLRLR